MIGLETQLRGEYQQQLAEKDTSISDLARDKAALESKPAERQQTISTQLRTISEMCSKHSNTQALKQRNRELHNRSENIKEEVTAAKSRLKALQNDLAAERAERAELKNKICSGCAKTLMHRKRGWQKKPRPPISCKNH